MILLISLSFITMTFFCLAMSEHREQVISQEIPHNICCFFRPLAWLLLIVTCYISVTLYGGSIGPAAFIGSLSGALLALILLLTYRPHILPILSIFLVGINLVNSFN